MYLSRLVLVIGAALAASQTSYAQLNVTLTPSLASPQPVGQSITFVASANSNSTALRYRFMIQAPGATAFNMVADYMKDNSMLWSSLQEGTYQVQAQVWNPTSGQTGNAVIPFQFTTRITGSIPVISPSAHPLVAIYSAPPCAAGTIQVVYHATPGATYFFSNTLPCQPGLSANFYIGGMRAQSTYRMWYKIVNNGNVTLGPVLSFQTGSIPTNVTLAPATIPIPVGSGTSRLDNILLQSFTELLGTSYPPTAYDLAGNATWYYPTTHPKQTYLTRPVAGGTFLIYLWINTADQTQVQEVDLQGNIVRETNTTTISQQLAALGLPTINWLSHEAIRLPSGHTLVLGMTERILTNVQGHGAVDVVGDMIIDLDQNLQVAWTWNTFDHLPNSRAPLLGEVCVSNTGACGPLFLAGTAHDWTHCNSLNLLPDGNLILSIRHQDWVVKIDYQNGAGTGKILWTLGNLAEQAGTSFFTLNGGVGSWPWFSHQHDVEFDGTNIELMDNGNTRVAPPPLGLGSGNSRGQVYSLDESTMVATQLLSSDLGSYSPGYGSAQLLSNGDYYFALGFVPIGRKPFDDGLEVVPNSSSLSYSVNFPSSAYRSFRLSGFYNYVQ